MAAALACPIRGYSNGRIISPTATLTASYGPNGGQVGFSMASSADGSVVVIGAPSTTLSGTSAGTASAAGVAYVFVEPASGWGATLPQPTIIEAFTPVANAYFGSSVAISSDGSRIVVGAPGDTGVTAGAGAAWVFNEPVPNGWAPGSYVQNIKLIASDGVSSDQFGASVGISGDGGTIVVGAENHQVTANLTNYADAGASYVFTAPSGTWGEVQELSAFSPSANENFGSSVAINADASAIIVGGPGNNSSQGAAYVFTAPAGTWSQLIELTASGGVSNDRFGSSVAISGTAAAGSTAVIGAPGASSSQGAAYVFTAPTGTWSQVAVLTASGATNGSELGTAVAISSDGGTIVAGAPGAPPAATGSYSQGTLYQFDQPAKGKTTLSWANETQSDTFEFSKSSQPTQVNFGFSVAVGLASRNSWAFAGAPGVGTSPGSAYIFAGK
ncbi:MAG TPA: hypothetical protein VNJ52_00265 [Patescibacteria group bacterium]|nr:hypothetical protein [Patescibacteria group bacterium]